MKRILPGLFVITLSTFMFSCQKELTEDPGTPSDTTVVTPPSQLDLLRDSVYLYTKEVYFWHSVIPPYDQFNPRQYAGSTDLESAENVMNAIKALQTNPQDRFSFVTTKAESDGLQTGESTDWGFFVKAGSADLATPIDSVHWYVNYVYDKSSAGLSGVKRGWYINKINNTTVTYDQAGANILNDIFYGTTTVATFEFTKSDGTVTTIDLNKTSFTANSVLYKNVFTTTSGQKVGYFVFNQFLGQPSRNELNDVFLDLQAAGIDELIIDLRYNHGGSTATQDTLAEFVAPSTANGKTMYSYEFNDSLQAGNFPLLKRKPGYSNVSFAKENNTVTYSTANRVNLSRVFVIVSGETASASELLINNLKPYMDVLLIGDTTYGKPVGFFPIDIFDYSIYPISFRTINSVGNADYYTGFAPDKTSYDAVDKDWGDVNEDCLFYALKYIVTGGFRTASSASRLAREDMRFKAQVSLKNVRAKLLDHKFSGMFYEKR